MTGPISINLPGVEEAAAAARRKVESWVRPPAANVPDPRFHEGAAENAERNRESDRKVERTADAARETGRQQGEADRGGTRAVNRVSSGPAAAAAGGGGAGAGGGTGAAGGGAGAGAGGMGAAPKALSADQMMAQQQYQQRIAQLMAPQQQQMGANAFQQMAPAMQQMAGQGASAMGQYPPGSVALSRSQLAELLEAVESSSSGGVDADGAPLPRSGSVDSFGEISEKGALSVEEVALQKTGAGVLTNEEVDQVILAAAEANGITDPDAQARWLNIMRPVVEHESTRNPDAGNGYDSNAVGSQQADGLPAKSSRGLAQTIPSTFAAYHVAGTSTNVYDPVANVAASMNYITHRYGGGNSDGTTLGEFHAARSGGRYLGY